MFDEYFWYGVVFGAVVVGIPLVLDLLFSPRH